MSEPLNHVTPKESQDWVLAVIDNVLRKATYGGDPDDRTIVGEDERGCIMAPRPGTEDVWEPFDVTKPEHREAARESSRRGVIAFLDLEPLSP